LEILRVLWKRGPSSVREVQKNLPPGDNNGYTTVLKMLQIMFAKGLVGREETGRSHCYYAILAEERAKSQMVKDLIDRLFDGAAQPLVLHALSARKATPEELAEIRRLLEQLESEEA
jgi:predicted transcriptional regulator